MTRFVIFELADGRLVYLDPAAVQVVYDHQSAIVGHPVSVVCTPTTNMPVPYSATRVMEILNG